MSSVLPTPDPAQPARVRRVLILCTHNSARSQMAEAWTRHLAQQAGVALEVHSAGSEATLVKPGALTVMAEVGLSLEAHRSKTLEDLPDPWNFDHVITVCDSADARCPVYPARTVRRHYPFRDPSGGPLEDWRAVRDAMQPQFAAFVQAVAGGQEAPPSFTESRPAPAATPA
ncbi:arsenate reductase ArsC [Deinococcus aerophilus]|uniref:arsenate reductase ArsC n=1 Tax=Deinococcus aerophilus TaxID=522488 RepID=UPI00227C3C74|nr:arsenate reductase ArsC [Deinococcus aerophilus]